MELTQADMKQLLDAIGRVGRVAEVSNIYQHLVDVSEGLFGDVRSSCELFRILTDTIAREGGIVCAPLTPQLDEVFLAMVLDHPFAEAVSSLRKTRLIQAPSGVTDGRAFDDYAIYHEFYRHIGVADQIVMAGVTEWPQIHLLSIGRETPFTPRERSLATLLLPHVTSAWHNWMALRQVEASLDAHEIAMSTVRTGLVHVDQRGRVLRWFGSGVTLLERHFSLVRRERDALPRPLQQWVQQQAAARLGEALPDLADDEPAVFTSPQGSLCVRLAPSRIRGRFMLVLQERMPTPKIETLQSLGLTRTQAHVLYCITQGMTNKQAAMQLGVHARTVSTHLEAIYRKLGVTNRTAAAARAAEVLWNR